MALCVGCGDDFFGGKVCYKCGQRVGGNEGVPQTPASPAPQYQQPQYQQPQYQQPQFQPQFQQQFLTAQKTNGLAIASFVCSFFCGILGIIFGIIAISQINKTNGNGKGLAIAGICLGAAAIVVTWIFWSSLFVLGSEY
jgi:hypothetical protein